MRLLLSWLLSAVALMIVGQIVPGIHISGLLSALVAVVVIGFVNATIGLLLKILTFPATLLTLGLFWWIVNGLMLWFASGFVPGFQVDGFGAAFFGAIVLALLNIAVHAVMRRVDRARVRS